MQYYLYVLIVSCHSEVGRYFDASILDDSDGDDNDIDDAIEVSRHSGRKSSPLWSPIALMMKKMMMIYMGFN